jgi:tetratricopeptide (TPR) repeat protein
MDRDAARALGAQMLAAGTARSVDAVRALAPIARAIAARTGDKALQIGIDVAYGRSLARSHELRESAAVCRDAIERAKAIDSGGQLNNSRICLLEALVPAGAYGEIDPLLDQLIAEEIRQSGSDHPRTSDFLEQRAAMEERRGKLAEARRDAERVLEIRRRAYAPNHVKIAEALGELASVAHAENKYDESATLYAQALDIEERVEPPPVVELSQMHASYAFVLEGNGQHKEALAQFAAADKMLRERGETNSLERAILLINYGQVEANDDVAAGIAMIEEAHSILDSKHDKRANSLYGAMAAIEVMHKRWPDARKHAEAALATIDADTDPHNRAFMAWLAAQSIAETKGDRTRARELAQSAHDGFAKLGPRLAPTVKAIETWLAKH